MGFDLRGSHPVSIIHLLIAFCLLGTVYPGVGRAGSDEKYARRIARTELRIARSDDGATFVDTGQVLLTGAAAPSISQRENGQLILVADVVATADDDSVVLMATARSGDGGASWSSLTPILINDREGRRVGGVHGAWLPMSKNRLRLYFVSDDRLDGRGRRRGEKHVSTVRSAVTRDGVRFLLDPRTDLRFPVRADLHPTVLSTGHRVLMFADSTGRRGQEGGKADAVYRAISRNGRDFVRLAPIKVTRHQFVGDVVMAADGARAYVSSSKGIVALRSQDGRTWKKIADVGLAAGSDPSVVRRSDGSFLMVYCAKREAAGGADSLAMLDGSDLLADAAWSESGPADFAVALDELEDGDERADTDDVVLEGEDEPALVEIGAASDAAEQGEGSERAERSGEGESSDAPPWGSEVHEDVYASDDSQYVRKPDFVKRVDYFMWYRAETEVDGENALDAYMAFMPGAPGSPTADIEWPDFNNMLEDRETRMSPAAWHPDAHPDWEASNAAVQDVMQKFAGATRVEGYGSPDTINKEYLKDFPEGDKLLLGIMLPNLSNHRRLARATLADAWRTEDGTVSPARMLKAWETVLRGANHLDSGVTLIEDLVATAERRMLHRSALAALRDGVFAGNDLTKSRDTLREFDLGDEDPGVFIRGEHAFAMDLAQYIFAPPSAGGQPQANMPRARAAFGFDRENEDVEERLDALAGMTAEDAFVAIDALDAFYREMAEQMSLGYPEVRAADLTAITQRGLYSSPLAEVMLPSLVRYYQLRVRNVTSRRATKLVYSIHVFRAEQDRWPRTLAELPADVDEEVRTDPFTGDYFGYRVTPEGPTVYSLGENARDDGGVHSPKWDDEITNDVGSDDFVFWPIPPRP